MEPSSSENAAPPPPPGWREMITDALRFWESRRLGYNAFLAGIVAYFFLKALPDSKAFLSVNSVLGLFILAVLANVCYCAAYFVDIFVQFSGFRGMRTRWRWALWAIGVAFAGAIAWFFAQDFFRSSSR
jgi:hypothetical protein